MASPPFVNSNGKPGKRQPTGWTINDQFGQVKEDGRTYHGYMAGEYALPNDGDEQNRLDFHHSGYLAVMDGKLAAAPLNCPRYVVDVGTGTGIWAIEFAQQNPMSEVFGTDLALTQPYGVCPNVNFLLENSETQEWEYPWPLDYVHFRSMGPCFNDTQKVIQMAYDSMAPGGWIEFQDGYWELMSPDRSIDGTALKRWSDYLILAGTRAGRDMTKAKQYKTYLEQSGFINIQEKIFNVPGSWAQSPRKARELGLWASTGMVHVVESYRKFLSFSGLYPEEIDRLIKQVNLDLRDHNIHWYMPIYVVFGQRPQD